MLIGIAVELAVAEARLAAAITHDLRIRSAGGSPTCRVVSQEATVVSCAGGDGDRGVKSWVDEGHLSLSEKLDLQHLNFPGQSLTGLEFVAGLVGDIVRRENLSPDWVHDVLRAKRYLSLEGVPPADEMASYMLLSTKRHLASYNCIRNLLNRPDDRQIAAALSKGREKTIRYTAFQVRYLLLLHDGKVAKRSLSLARWMYCYCQTQVDQDRILNALARGHDFESIRTKQLAATHDALEDAWDKTASSRQVCMAIEAFSLDPAELWKGEPHANTVRAAAVADAALYRLGALRRPRQPWKNIDQLHDSYPDPYLGAGARPIFRPRPRAARTAENAGGNVGPRHLILQATTTEAAFLEAAGAVVGDVVAQAADRAV